MPLKTHWLIPKQIAFMYVWDDLVIEDFDTINRDLLAMLEDTPERLHFIVDDSQSNTIPINLRGLSESLQFIRHPKLRWILTIGESSFLVNITISTLMRTLRQDYKRLATFDQACDFLKHEDKTLTWEHADIATLAQYSTHHNTLAKNECEHE